MNFQKIQSLLQERADYKSRLNLIPYDGTPEVKTRNNKKYLYVRKRVAGRLTSKYIDVYSDDLYQLLLKNSKTAKELRREIRKIDKELALLNYEETTLSNKTILNIDFARANLNKNIYDQAVLEGIGTTFPQTEDILENRKIVGVKTTDVQKILNLKHAWEFILDRDIISYPSDYYILCAIARLINEGFYNNGGTPRKLPVRVMGSSYIPPIPDEEKVKNEINHIISSSDSIVDKAIHICLYCMKTQIFIDGNKRAAVVFANHYLISNGGGLLVIPEDKVQEFKNMLVLYYEGKDDNALFSFLKSRCFRRI